MKHREKDSSGPGEKQESGQEYFCTAKFLSDTDPYVALAEHECSCSYNVFTVHEFDNSHVQETCHTLAGKLSQVAWTKELNNASVAVFIIYTFMCLSIVYILHYQ